MALEAPFPPRPGLRRAEGDCARRVRTGNCTARGRRPNGPAFKESLNQVTELLRDVGIIDDVSSTILAFQPTSSMNDSAATLARTAARLRPLCVIHHAMCHHLHIRGGEGGHRCCAARARENQNEEAVADAPKVKAMRTSVGWFSNRRRAL